MYNGQVHLISMFRDSVIQNYRYTWENIILLSTTFMSYDIMVFTIYKVYETFHTQRDRYMHRDEQTRTSKRGLKFERVRVGFY